MVEELESCFASFSWQTKLQSGWLNERSLFYFRHLP
nr:MAG TPA: hypothetical protein [Caudoviricetes sp.]